jgi:hypothetical protein
MNRLAHCQQSGLPGNRPLLVSCFSSYIHKQQIINKLTSTMASDTTAGQETKSDLAGNWIANQERTPVTAYAFSRFRDGGFRQFPRLYPTA